MCQALFSRLIYRSSVFCCNLQGRRLSPFYRWETEVQRSEVTCLDSQLGPWTLLAVLLASGPSLAVQVWSCRKKSPPYLRTITSGSLLLTWQFFIWIWCAKLNMIVIWKHADSGRCEVAWLSGFWNSKKWWIKKKKQASCSQVIKSGQKIIRHSLHNMYRTLEVTFYGFI